MTLHWLVAVGVLAQIALGLWMIDIPKEPVGVRAYWFNLHKSIGMTVGILIVARLAWRLTHRPPPLPPAMPRWQLRAARASHMLLYACMITMPLAGYLGSTFSGYPIKYFGATLPGWGWKDEVLKDFFSTVHFVAAAGVHFADQSARSGRSEAPAVRPRRRLPPHAAAPVRRGGLRARP